jgi:hypothetical protein
MDEAYQPADDVQVLMEISGSYDDVMTKLQASARGRGAIDRFVQDINVLLDTVVDLRGGTRSAIADELPPEMNLRYDAEMVVKTLQVLKATPGCPARHSDHTCARNDHRGRQAIGAPPSEMRT